MIFATVQAGVFIR